MSDWQQSPSQPKAPSRQHKMPSVMSPQPSNRNSLATVGYESFASRPVVHPHSLPQNKKPKITPHLQTSPYQPGDYQSGVQISPSHSNPINHTQDDDFHTSAPTQIHGQRSHINVQKQIRARLRVIAGEQVGNDFFLNRELTHIGRSLDNDIVLLDIATSRKHFQIRRHNIGFTVFDLESANGLYLNQIRISEEELYDGDELEVGETILKYESIGFSRVKEKEDDTDPGLQSIPQLPALSKNESTAAQRSSNEFMLTLNAESMQKMQDKTWQQKFSSSIDSFEEWCYYVMNDQGEIAKIFRRVLLILALIGSLWLGKVLSEQKVDLIQLETEIKQVLRNADIARANTLYQDKVKFLEPEMSAHLQNLIQEEIKVNQAFNELKIAVQQMSWVDCVQKANVFPQQHRLSLNVQQFNVKCKQALFQTIIPQARLALWRGEFQKAQELVQQLTLYQTNLNDTNVLALNYAIWLHQYFLKLPLDQVNPSLRERKLLAQVVDMSQKGKFKQAIRSLKRGMPQNSSRKKLFKLRLRAVKFLYKKNKILAQINSDEKSEVDLHSLAYLNANQLNVYAMLKRYQKSIQQAIKARNYPILAQWIEASLLISPQHEDLLSLKQKLITNAQKWYKLGKEAMQNGQSKRALGFMKAALPFLSKPVQQEAQQLIQNL
jgi:pSer/pThr/pTyr-binding forkhead associated (FHA) protein